MFSMSVIVQSTKSLQLPRVSQLEARASRCEVGVEGDVMVAVMGKVSLVCPAVLVALGTGPALRRRSAAACFWGLDGRASTGHKGPLRAADSPRSAGAFGVGFLR